MTDRQFQPDLTGSDETLEHLLDRLRSFSRRRPVRPGRDPDWEFITSRRPPRGAGGAEAPLPKTETRPDACAPS